MQLRSNLATHSQTFQQNREFHQHQWQQLADLQAKITAGQPPPTGPKLGVRARVAKLIDPQTEFLELSLFAGHEVYEHPSPAAGLMTGVGTIHGRPCMIIANDWQVKGGSYMPLTVKKHLRAQQIAANNHLPCLYLVDSAGAFLPKQAELFADHDGFGRIFHNQARMSAQGIPQLAAVHGACTAGGAYIPAMADQSVIVRHTGHIFLAGPPLVAAATGETISAEALGGAEVHTAISGVADHMAASDTEALEMLRTILGTIRPATKPHLTLAPPAPPAYDPEEIWGLLPQEPTQPFEAREVIARLVDRSEFFEFKPAYGPTLVTGFAHLGGIPIGILANNGILFNESAQKGCHFIQLCLQEQRPLLFLQNVTGFMVGKQAEHGGIAKEGAKLVHAVAACRLPKVTLITASSFGAGNYGMCGRAFDPDYLFTWPHARIAVMGGEQAAQVLVGIKTAQLKKKGLALGAEQAETLRQEVVSEYARTSTALYGSARLWDDGILNPCTTRAALWQAFASTLQHPWPPARLGTLRM